MTASTISLSQRDFALLRLLEITPVTAAQIRRASEAFGAEPFRDERRVRERMQILTRHALTKTFSASHFAGGSVHYYRLATAGYRAIHPDSEDPIPKSANAQISPSRFQHSMATADVIVHLFASCYRHHVQVTRSTGDRQLTLEVGEYRQQPDCHFQLAYAGMTFNLLFEIDNSTEPLESRREQSIRTKILGYESYQDWVLQLWKRSGRVGVRPLFRVIFLTRGADRARHILWLAHELATNKDRRLVYATTQDQFLGSPNAVVLPIFNDHHGFWQALINPHPTSPFQPRAPIRISSPVAPRTFVQ